LSTAIYSAILILFSRKLRKAIKRKKAAEAEAAELAMLADEEMKAEAAGPSNRSSIEEDGGVGRNRNINS
jgi:hypothetical protein